MTDIELLYQVIVHPKFTPELATQVISIITEVATKSLVYTRTSLGMLMTILARFENNTQIYEHIQAVIRGIYHVILEQDQQKNELYVEILRTNPRAKLRTKKRSHALLVSQGAQAARKQVSMSLD